MSTVQMEQCHLTEPRPKRSKIEATKQRLFGTFHTEKTLDISGVISVLKGYEDYDGGINCSICGKLYKSKVCFTKHLWEHSVYWDLFDGAKNHDRVLSIQAALILCNSYHPEEEVASLLVTAPHTPEKKKEKDININDIHPIAEKKSATPRKAGPSVKAKSPSKSPKRKRSSSGSVSS